MITLSFHRTTVSPSWETQDRERGDVPDETFNSRRVFPNTPTFVDSVVATCETCGWTDSTETQSDWAFVQSCRRHADGHGWVRTETIDG